MDRPFEDLSMSGLLWLINRTVFHPRGYALAITLDDGKAVGWSLLGDGSEPWEYGIDEKDHFRRAEATLKGNARQPAVAAHDGTFQISLSPDGAIVLGQADQSIAMSLQLLRQLQSPDFQGCASRRDGMVVFTGVDSDGQSTQVVYREVGFNPTPDPDANECGFLLLERIS